MREYGPVRQLPDSLLERRLALIVEHFPMAILLETVDRKVSQTNQAFCDMFGIPAPPGALVGADCAQAAIQLAPLWGDLDSFLARVDQLIAEGRSVVGDRIELTDGRVLERDFLRIPVDESRGEIAWIYRDVTAMDSARRQAEADALKRADLLSTISHDVRTPVVGIVGMVDLLLQQPLDPRTRELVEGVQSSTAGLTTMLDDLLDLARVDAGGLEIGFEETSICDLVESVVNMVGPLAQAKSLPLIGGAAPDVPETVRTDPGRLRQVLLNLVANAVKFTTAGAVTVLAERDGSDLLVTVSDTGPGMSPEAAERVFDQFVQGGSTVNRVHGGAGLGLAIANRLAAALGGSIKVTSSVGVGSDFQVRLSGVIAQPRPEPQPRGLVAHVSGPEAALPVVTASLQRLGVALGSGRDDPAVTVEVVIVGSVGEAQRVSPPAPGRRLVILVPAPLAAVPPLAGTPVALPWTRDRLAAVLRDDWVPQASASVGLLKTGTRVLLAEDEPSNRRILTEMLTRLGAHVVAVGNGLEAVETVAADSFDIVLMDLAMPVMDGLRAAEIIASRLPADRCPPILALTADSSPDRSFLAGSGFSGYLRKPVTSAQLTQAITGALEAVAVLVVDPGDEAAHPPVSVEVLKDLAADIGDAQVVLETIDIYLEELPTRLSAMSLALQGDHMDALRDAAHALKSSSRMLGAENLADLCRDLEAATAAQSRLGSSDGGDMTPLVDALHSEALRVGEWLSVFRASGNPGLA